MNLSSARYLFTVLFSLLVAAFTCTIRADENFLHIPHNGPLTYRDNTITRIDTPNGFIDGEGEIYYYVKDYQGNIRQVTDADGNVLQDNHYYPYGMLMAESSDILAANRRSAPSLLPAPTSAIGFFNPYLFGGKEYIPFKGSNYLDFSARIYDNTTITFGTPDQLREKYTNIHSSLYCAANPIILIDPSGMLFKYYGTEEEITAFFNLVRDLNMACSFNYVYSSLENSPTKYEIKFVDDIPNPNDETKQCQGKKCGNTILINSKLIINNDIYPIKFVFCEELYHLYQSINTLSYNNISVFSNNDEFEAKTFAIIALINSPLAFTCYDQEGVEIWSDFIVANCIDQDLISIIKSNYVAFGKKFVEYNKNNAQVGYRTPVTNIPYRLLYLLYIYAYPK